MVKYGIITHYNVHNHGAFLQLNGLCKVLKRDFDINAQALQFEKNYDFAEAGVKEKFKLSFRSIIYFISYIRERGLKLFLFNIKKKKLFADFVKNEDLIGPRCDQSEKLDGVIVGSDEVFSLHLGPTPELFGYNLPSNKVFSYAGCFGSTTLETVRSLNCEKFVRDGLKSMKGLSMRDQNSILIAKELTGKGVTLVVDPVILYGYEKELEGLTKPDLPNYLLVYAYESRLNDPKEYQAILDYAHSKGMKVICPGFFHRWADENINTDPIELLRYFKYAECVVTDTFHGAVMSIITGRELAVKIRDNGNKLMNLLSEYELDNRVISDDWNLDAIFSQQQDNEHVRSEVERRRKASMDYLGRMINS